MDFGVTFQTDPPAWRVVELTKPAEQLGTKGYEAASLEGGMKAWSLAWNVAEVPVERSEARVFQLRRTGAVFRRRIDGMQNSKQRKRSSDGLISAFNLEEGRLARSRCRER